MDKHKGEKPRTEWQPLISRLEKSQKYVFVAIVTSVLLLLLVFLLLIRLFFS
jgi:hypothetical protein